MMSQRARIPLQGQRQHSQPSFCPLPITSKGREALQRGRKARPSVFAGGCKHMAENRSSCNAALPEKGIEIKVVK